MISQHVESASAAHCELIWHELMPHPVNWSPCQASASPPQLPRLMSFDYGSPLRFTVHTYMRCSTAVVVRCCAAR